jgi:hypothetical protein
MRRGARTVEPAARRRPSTGRSYGANAAFGEKWASVTGFPYDPVAAQYVYGWRTERGCAGSCQRFTLALTSGESLVIDFRFRQAAASAWPAHRRTPRGPNATARGWADAPHRCQGRSAAPAASRQPAAAAAARPATRPLNRQPPRNVPSSAR